MRVLPRAFVVATVGALLVGLCSCGAKPSDTGAVAGASPQPSQVFQHRSLECGGEVASPAVPSKPSDIIQLTVTKVRRASTAITASYSVSAPDRSTYLTLPIGPTPLTILLLRNGKIVGRQQPAKSDGTVDGSAAQGYNVGAKPWTGELTVDQLCPGVTWTEVGANPDKYSLEILMSQQPGGGPQTAPPPAYLADPLTIATATL